MKVNVVSVMQAFTNDYIVGSMWRDENKTII